MSKFKVINLNKMPSKMIKAAKELKEGRILIAYRDFNAIRIETENGMNPYVWRDEKFRKMESPRDL